MGLFRKVTSISTGGLVDFRSDKERTARYAKQIRDDARRQARRQRQAITAAVPERHPPPLVSATTLELERLAALRRAGDLSEEEFAAAKATVLGVRYPSAPAAAPTPTSPAAPTRPGWYPDPRGGPRQRYWSGTAWAPD